MKKILCILSCLTFPLLSHATSLVDLESQNKSDTGSKEGKAYESKVVEHFFSDKAFMATCFPEKIPMPDPMKIYIVVTPQGQLTELKIDPDNDSAKCISSNLKINSFPAKTKSKKNFVAKISLQIKD